MALTKEKIGKISTTLARIVQLKRKLLDREMKPLGFSRSDWQVLLWLNQLGECTQQNLIKLTEMNPAQLVRILESLEEKKIIERTKIKNDRRFLFINLLPTGEEIINGHVKSIIEKAENILFQGISNVEKEKFQEILHKIKENLKKEIYGHGN